MIECVFFDLDGTLVDTAPDLVSSLNATLSANGFANVDFDNVKPKITFGMLAMLEFSIQQYDLSLENKQHLLNEVLDRYENNIAVHSRFFDGMVEVLETLESRNIKWGIITNKRERFTYPLAQAMGLSSKAACIVSGDTTAHSKPHPAPMLEACKRAAVDPLRSLYVGDAEHDMLAGKSVQMKTLVAAYGYLTESDDPTQWGADGLVESPSQIIEWLENIR